MGLGGGVGRGLGVVWDLGVGVGLGVAVGVAVAVEEGLLVPVVRFADTKPLSQIAAEVKDFAQRAKDKKLQPADWEGSTFTISNLGMFGIEEFTAIINPPNSAILAVGAASPQPTVIEGSVVVRQRMKITKSCDHRVIDGAIGAQFLRTFKQIMENPQSLTGRYLKGTLEVPVPEQRREGRGKPLVIVALAR